MNFYWEGIDHQGIRVKGTLTAENSTAILEELKNKKITPLKIKKIIFLVKNKKINTQQLTDFTRQLASLINTNITLTTALAILEQSSENRLLQRITAQLRQQIEAGHSLSTAMTQLPHYFPKLYCQLVYIGEQSGCLVTLLEQIATHQEKMDRLTKKVKKALFYPLVVIIIATVVTAILLLFVVPQFSKLFSEFGATLPFYTRLVLQIADKASYFFSALVILLIASSGLYYLSKNNTQLHYHRDRLLLALPWIGTVLKQNIWVRFTQTLAVTLEAALPLTEALHIIAGTCNNVIYTQAILKIRAQVLTGQSLHNAMQSTCLFPNRLLQVIAVAEETGLLKIALQQTAVFYEQQVDENMTQLTQLLEPVIMLVLGLVIGGLITAIYLPIFKLGNVI